MPLKKPELKPVHTYGIINEREPWPTTFLVPHKIGENLNKMTKNNPLMNERFFNTMYTWMKHLKHTRISAQNGKDHLIYHDPIYILYSLWNLPNTATFQQQPVNLSLPYLRRQGRKRRGKRWHGGREKGEEKEDEEKEEEG